MCIFLNFFIISHVSNRPHNKISKEEKSLVTKWLIMYDVTNVGFRTLVEKKEHFANLDEVKSEIRVVSY